MHFGRCHKGAHTDLITHIFLHVDGPFLYPEFGGKKAESIFEKLPAF